MSMNKSAVAWEDLNTVLLFLGVALSFSTLQDTTKTQNKLSLRIWQHPVMGNIFLLLIGLMCISCLIIGLVGYLENTETIRKDVSLGLIVLGISLKKMLKAGAEMFDNHRIVILNSKSINEVSSEVFKSFAFSILQK